MDECIINQTEQYLKKDFLLFRFFKSNQIFKRAKKQEENICIFSLPIPEKLYGKQKEKYYFSFIKYLKKNGIKKICFGRLKDTFFKDILKKEFDYYRGNDVFCEYFSSVLSFFTEKKGIEIEKLTINFICEHETVLEKYLEKCIKKVKKINIFTTNPKRFQNLQEKMQEKTGIFISFHQDVKKYNNIYINLEEKNIFSDIFFQSVDMIDPFSVYKNSYNNIIFFFPTKQDSFLKENGIKKTCAVVEYLQNNQKFCISKTKKIANIQKYD